MESSGRDLPKLVRVVLIFDNEEHFEVDFAKNVNWTDSQGQSAQEILIADLREAWSQEYHVSIDLHLNVNRT